MRSFTSTIIKIVLILAFSSAPYTMLQAQIYTPKLVLAEDEKSTEYLTQVFPMNMITYFGRNGETDINFIYETGRELKNTDEVLKTSYFVQLIPETDGRYRVMSTLRNAAYHTKSGEFKAQAAVMPQKGVIGYTDNPDLTAVKAWNYLKQENAKITYYTLNQVTTAPQTEQIKPSKTLAEYIKTIAGNTLKNTTGSITLGYTVDGNTGETGNVEIKKQNLAGGTVGTAEIYQVITSTLFRIRWAPAKLNGKPVSVKNEITVQF